jgi:molybdenum cofactor cytidylyltransferase
VKATLAAIVLAAGASRRLGQPKQLLMHAGETLLARSIRLADEAGAGPMLVVLGADHEMILAEVTSNDANFVINENWEQGIATSIHTGLAALDGICGDASGVLILGCDQPRLTVAHLRVLIETFVAQAEPSIVASAYAGVHGIPAVFPRAAFGELLALSGDRGARALLTEPSHPVIAVPFTGGEIDIDQPSDLRELH